MGTSSIYNGKNDYNPLLPEDYDEPQVNSDDKSKVKWKTVKTDMSKFIRSGGQKGSVSHITKQYIKASGGSSKMLSQSTSGVATGIRIGTFFNSVITNGLVVTFRNLGIEFSGRKIEEVFSKLINVLAPDSNSKEDIVAKEAAEEALSKIYDYVEKNKMELECLEKMPIDLMNEALCEYVSSYIWVLIMNDLESRFEKYIDDAKQTLALEKEFKDYISSVVKTEFNSKGDIINQDVNSSISDLYMKCFEVLEGTL
jgi:hypothetical protein